MTDNPWTDQRISELRRLLAAKLSLSQVAKRLGVTRNAALGKARRLRIGIDRAASGRLSQFERALRLRRREAMVDARRQLQPAAKLPTSAIPPPTARDPLNLVIAELEPGQCRYITNEDIAHARYCGRAAIGGTSWCAFHLERVKAAPTAVSPPLGAAARAPPRSGRRSNVHRSKGRE